MADDNGLSPNSVADREITMGAADRVFATIEGNDNAAAVYVNTKLAIGSVYNALGNAGLNKRTDITAFFDTVKDRRNSVTIIGLDWGIVSNYRVKLEFGNVEISFYDNSKTDKEVSGTSAHCTVVWR
ncbi:MAG: hypothetical protein Rhirs2KO_12600 [Rhizobiaceae bacterium]